MTWFQGLITARRLACGRWGTRECPAGVSKVANRRPMRLTAIVEREDEGFVSLCPELDIASQGSSVEEAEANLVEAFTLFFENAGASAVTRRFYLLHRTPIDASGPHQPVPEHGHEVARHRLGAQLLQREFHLAAPVRILPGGGGQVLLGDLFGQILLIDGQQL